MKEFVIFLFLIFGKGGGSIFEIGNKIEIIEDSSLGGFSTDEIILKIILLQNPNILNKMSEAEQRIEEEITSDLTILMKENPDYESSKIIRKFKRDYKLIKKVKEKINKCQICNFTFKKKNGENYNEVHHILSLSKNGKDDEINTLVLCANCHKQLHYADVDISNILNGKLIINGEEKQVNK